jgi:ribonuclease P protein component
MEAAERNLFPEKERLSLKKDIDKLFNNGLSVIAYPLRVLYLLQTEETSENGEVSILVSVPKKRFKRAVKRNRLKRLMRESYRLNNSELKSTVSRSGKNLSVAFIYISDSVCLYKDIEKAMLKAIEMLNNKIII